MEQRSTRFTRWISCLLLCFEIIGVGAQLSSNAKYVKATVGSTVVLPCDTEHDRFDLIEWRRNDTTVPVYMKFQSYPPNTPPAFADRVRLQNGKDLEITGVQIDDIAVYMCKTMMSTGDSSTFERGSSIFLDVQERPSCKGSPSSFITAVIGASAVLPCIVGGSPEPTISWSRNDGVLPTGRYIITATGLSIQGIEQSDSGRYQVTLSSSAGTYAHVIELVVQSSSSVRPSSYVNAVEGRFVSVPCGKVDSVDGVSVVWTNKGADVTRISRFTVKQSSGEMHVDPSVRTDSGVYQCSVRRRQADGSTVTVTYDMYLNVQHLPEITSYKSIIHSSVGDDVVIPCVAVGNPDVTITWIYDGVPIISGGSHYLVSTNGSLVVYRLTIKDAGVYTCAPTNKLGPGKQRSTSLSVMVPPQFVAKGNRIIALEKGRNASFNCMATGTPMPNITWYHLSRVKPLRDSAQNKGILRINNIQTQHHGIYRCVVSSKAGSLMQDFTLIVIASPSKPTNFTANSYNRTVLAKWLSGYDGGSKQSLQVWYRPSRAHDVDWRYVLTLKDELNVTGLEIGPYFFSVRGVNDNGVGPFSKIIEVNITGNPALGIKPGIVIGDRLSLQPPPPFHLTVNVTSKGYELQWINVLPPGRPPVEVYVLQTRLVNSSKPWKQVSSIIGKDTTAFLLHTSELKSTEMHEFRMFSRSPRAKSDVIYPDKTFITALPASNVRAGPGKKGGSDPLVFIILAVVIAFILLILLISLICFVKNVRRRRKRLYGAGTTSRKVHFDFTRSHCYKPNRPLEDGDSPDCIDVSDRKKLHRTKKEVIRESSNQRVTNSDAEEFQRLLSQESEANNRVHMLLPKGTPDETHFVRKKYLSLQRSCPYYTHRPVLVKAKKAGKLFKSSSMPCVLFDAKEGSDDENQTAIPADIVDNDEFDVSDLETDNVGTITRKKAARSPLKSAKFKDSFDQFCRPANEKEIARKTKPANLNQHTEVDFYVSRGDADSDSGSSKRSPLDGKENDIDSNARLFLINGNSKRELSESSGENSSDDICEGDISGSDQPSPKDNRKTDPSFHYPQPRANPGRFLSKDAVRQLHDASSLDRQSCQSLKSSGFESAAPSQCSTSDIDVKPHMPVSYVSSYGSRDSDGGSDYSFRCSPIMGRKIKVYPTIDEPYEWDKSRMSSLRRSINREQSNTPDLTDNEEFYENIMNMQRDMGVDLEDSWENLNEKDPLAPLPSVTSLPRKGYKPNGGPGYATGPSYSDHEKSRRCAQLLQEFKTKKNTDGSPTHNTIARCSSVMADMIHSEKPVVPKLQRSHSTGGEVVFREWLV